MTTRELKRLTEDRSKRAEQLVSLDREIPALRGELDGAVDDPKLFERLSARLAGKNAQRTTVASILSRLDAEIGPARERAVDQDLAAEAAEVERKAVRVSRELLKHYTAMSALQAFLRDELAPHKAEVEGLNQKLRERRARGDAGPEFDHILDGELRVRQIPGKTVPARYEERTGWRRIDGSPVMMFRTDASGELVPDPYQEGGARKVTERVQVAPETFVGVQTPPSLLDAVKLPGLRAGDPPLWPKR